MKKPEILAPAGNFEKLKSAVAFGADAVYLAGLSFGMRSAAGNFTAEELLVPIFKNGKQVYELPTIKEIRKHCEEEIEGMWDEVRRFTNPHNYYVDLSEKLWQIKHHMISEHRKKSK